MDEDIDDKVRTGLRSIPEDPDAPGRIVASLAQRRRPIGAYWLVGGSALAGVIGFAIAFLQGPITQVDGGDTLLLFLSGAL